MPRTPPPSLQHWSPLQRRSTLLTTICGPSSPLALIEYSPRKNHNQPFHTTPSHNAARPAPSTRRVPRRVPQRTDPSKLAFSADDLLRGLPETRREVVTDITAELQNLEKNGFRLASEMLHDGLINKNMTPTKFKRIGRALLELLSRNSRPFPDAITSIAQAESVTLDTVHDISHVIVRRKEQIALLSNSCAHAGSRKAIFIIASSYLKGFHRGAPLWAERSVPQPPRTRMLDLVETLATQTGPDTGGQDNRDPRAMLIYAKFLGLRGHYAQALGLVEELMRLIEPRTRLNPNEDLVLAGNTEPPWELYLWLRREFNNKESDIKVTAQNSEEQTGIDESGHGQEAVDTYLDPIEIDVLRQGAEEYQHPYSLICYAVARGWTDGIHEYEKYMVQAAASGNRWACQFLANFYYLVFLGRYPRPVVRPGIAAAKLRGTGQSAHPGVRRKQWQDEASLYSKLLSYFRPRPSREYRALAMEWYRVAWESGCYASGVRLARIHILEGDTEIGQALLDEIEGRATETGNLERIFKTLKHVRSNISSGRVQFPIHHLHVGEEFIPGWVASTRQSAEKKEGF